jgi:CubicO group peptidase (beta-lactamase class C family)
MVDEQSGGAAKPRHLDAAISSAVETGQIVGSVVLAARNGKLVYQAASGLADRESGCRVSLDTVFRLASMTKPIVSVAALSLIERGMASLDDPIDRFLPWFRPCLVDGSCPRMTVRHLLTHTAGLSYSFFQPGIGPYREAGISDGLDSSGLTLEENLRRLASVPLYSVPGATWQYSLATDVLGGVLEKIADAPLESIVASLVTEPLGMSLTRFRVIDADRLATPYVSIPNSPPARMRDSEPVPLPLAGAIQFSPGRATEAEAYPSGGAGMVGTASDYLLFLEALRTGGGPLLRPSSVAAMMIDAVPGQDLVSYGPGWGFGLGVALLREPSAAGVGLHKGSWSWGGVYGTNFWVDPASGLSVVCLTNTTLAGAFGEFPLGVINAV